MRRLIRVTKGLQVAEKNDISKYIPDYTGAVEDSIRLWNTMMESSHGCDCRCDHDGHFAGIIQAPIPGNPLEQLHSYSGNGIDPDQNFGGYAISVHETPGHKCYPYGHGGGLIGSVDGAGNVTVKPTGTPGNDASFMYYPYYPKTAIVLDHVIDTFNHTILHYIVNALLVKRCHTDKPVRQMNMEDAFYGVLEKVTSYMSTSTKEEIIGISCVDTQFGDDANTVYQNVILIHLSSLELSPSFRMLCTDLNKAGLVVRYGTQTEIDTVLKNKNTIMNWSFGFSCADPKALDLIFSGCRTTEALQHKIKVHSTCNIGLSCPSNIDMLVDDGESLQISVSMKKSFMVGAIVVNTSTAPTARIPIMDCAKVKLAEFGISLKEDVITSGFGDYTVYNMHIDNVTTDMEIIVVESIITEDMGYFSCNAKNTNISFRVPNLTQVEPNTIIPCDIDLQFDRSVTLANLGGIHACVIPVDMYNLKDIPLAYLTARTVNVIPAGFGLEPVYRITTMINSNLLNKTGTVIVRFVFDDGTLSTKNTSGYVRNAKCCMQFECQLGTATPLSYWVGILPDDTSTICPTVPSTMSFAKLNPDQASYFHLASNGNGSYSLWNEETTVVPEGLTNKAIYNVKTYHGLKSGEKFYFAQIMIPIAGLYVDHDVDLKTGDFFRGVDVEVSSCVNGDFHMVCEESGLVSTTLNPICDREEFKICYKGLSRPWVDGYIEIPVIFAKKDLVTIFIPAVSKPICIFVDLKIPEDEDNGDENPDNPENSDTGNTGDKENTELVEGLHVGVNIVSNGDIIICDQVGTTESPDYEYIVFRYPQYSEEEEPSVLTNQTAAQVLEIIGENTILGTDNTYLVSRDVGQVVTADGIKYAYHTDNQFAIDGFIGVVTDEHMKLSHPLEVGPIYVNGSKMFFDTSAPTEDKLLDAGYNLMHNGDMIFVDQNVTDITNPARYTLYDYTTGRENGMRMSHCAFSDLWKRFVGGDYKTTYGSLKLDPDKKGDSSYRELYLPIIHDESDPSDFLVAVYAVNDDNVVSALVGTASSSALNGASLVDVDIVASATAITIATK